MKIICLLPLFLPMWVCAQTQAPNADSVKAVSSIKYYTKQIAQTPTAIAFYKRGAAKRTLEDNKGAIEDLDQAIKLNPKYEDALLDRGLSKDAIEDYKGAIADFTLVINLNPKRAIAYYDRAMSKKQTEDYKGALADLDKAVELEPKDNDYYNERGIVKKQLQV